MFNSVLKLALLAFPMPYRNLKSAQPRKGKLEMIN